MMTKITLALFIAITGSSLHAEPVEKDNIHMFPQPPQGFTRHVIEMPETDNGSDHKVELLIGKKMLVDCNRHSLSGHVESVMVKGWGYKYLKVTDIRNGPSTMMACSEPKTEKFISIPPTFSRYNSRLPIVAYTPEGIEVRYRIWSADDKTQSSVQR